MPAQTSTRVLLIRHGETAWNAEGRIQGQLDVPLSSAGIWQARRLAERLAHEAPPLAAVIASDLARAWLTAGPLAAAFNLEPMADMRLRERSFGRFQGHTLEEIATRWPQDFALWRARDPAWPIPEGESALAFIDRVLEALHDLALAHAGSTVAVVTHGGVLDVAYRFARSLPWNATREHLMLNCGINRVTASARPLTLAIEAWGDVAHLAEARDELTGG